MCTYLVQVDIADLIIMCTYLVQVDIADLIIMPSIMLLTSSHHAADIILCVIMLLSLAFWLSF